MQYSTFNTKTNNNDMASLMGSICSMVAFVIGVSQFRHVCLFISSKMLMFSSAISDNILDYTELADLVVKSGGAFYILLKIVRFLKHKHDSKKEDK